ncbi:MAG TPA: MFS transporter [Deinococcales bacterium]|nr:MFS transporter [Deinococcales bacterium]
MTAEPQGAPAATGSEGLLLRVAIAGLGGTLLLRLAGGIATSALALYLRSLDVSPYSVALVATGYYLAELLLSPVLGALSDRVGRRALMVITPLIGAVALLLYPLSALVPVLALIRLLEGVSAAGAVPATLGYLSDLTSRSPHRGRIMGLFEMVTLIGLAGGTIIGPRVWTALGTSTYAWLAGIYVLGALAFLLGLPHVGAITRHRRSLKDYGAILASRRLMRFIPSWLAVNAILGLWVVHLQNQLSGEAGRVPGQALVGGLNGAALSNVMAAFAAAFLAGLYFWAARSGIGRRTTPMIWSGYGVLWVSVFLLLLNHPEWLPFLPGSLLFVLMLAGAFVMAGFTPVALAYLADISEDFPNDRGVVVGLYSVFLALGQLVGGNLGGAFVTALHVDGIAILTAILAVVAMLGIGNIRRVSAD